MKGQWSTKEKRVGGGGEYSGSVSVKRRTGADDWRERQRQKQKDLTERQKGREFQCQQDRETEIFFSQENERWWLIKERQKQRERKGAGQFTLLHRKRTGEKRARGTRQAKKVCYQNHDQDRELISRRSETKEVSPLAAGWRGEVAKVAEKVRRLSTRQSLIDCQQIVTGKGRARGARGSNLVSTPEPLALQCAHWWSESSLGRQSDGSFLQDACSLGIRFIMHQQNTCFDHFLSRNGNAEAIFGDVAIDPEIKQRGKKEKVAHFWWFWCYDCMRERESRCHRDFNSRSQACESDVLTIKPWSFLRNGAAIKFLSIKFISPSSHFTEQLVRFNNP